MFALQLLIILISVQSTWSQSLNSIPSEGEKNKTVKKYVNNIPPRLMVAVSFQVPFNSLGISFGELSNAFYQKKPQRISGFGAVHYNFVNNNISNAANALSGNIISPTVATSYFDFVGGITIHLKGPHWLYSGLGYGEYITYDKRELNGETYYTQSSIESESGKGVAAVIGYIIDFNGVNVKFGIKNVSRATLFNVGIGYTFKYKK